jgi:hypothetical protein
MSLPEEGSLFELKQTLEDPAFKERLYRVGKHTLKTASEAGFVVHRASDFDEDEGGLIIPSKIAYSTITSSSSIEDLHEAEALNMHSLYGYEDELITTVHSHPSPSRLKGGTFLYQYPSIPDATINEQLRQENPGLVEGIACFDQITNIGRLLLYRHKSNEAPRLSWYDDLTFANDYPTRSHETMLGNGFGITTLDFDMGSRTYIEDDMATKLEELY